MMITWVLEKNIFDNEQALFSLILDKGHKVIFKEYYPFDDKGNAVFFFDDTTCGVFRGSLNLARYLKNMCKLYPGVIYENDNYNCSTYFNHFGKFCLNAREYMIIPIGDLERQLPFLFSKLATYSDAIFVRPDSGNKQFTGQLIRRSTVESDLKQIKFYDPDDNELVVVSKAFSNIVAEYRFVIIGDEIITGCQYNYKGKHDERKLDSDNISDVNAKKMASHILSNTTWRPDDVFIMDICKTRNKLYHMLEINCFSCAGLYACDMNIIIDSVSKLAEAKYKAYMADIEI